MFTDIRIDEQTKEVIIPFSLSADKTVSAILLDKDGNFITSIFSGIRYKKGFNTFRWNRKDVLRNTVAAGKYKVQLGFNDFSAEWEGGIGNNSIKTTWPEEYQGYYFTVDIAVAGKYLYQCNYYNESQPSLHRCSLDTIHIHEFVINNRCTIDRICSDDSRVYCLTRGRVADDGHGAHVFNEFVFAVSVASNKQIQFSEGTSVTLNNFHDGTYSAINSEILNNDSKGKHIPKKIAFAVQQKGHYLFTAYTNENRIRVNDKETGAFVQDNKISSPRLLSVIDNLLIVYDGTSLKKYFIDFSGHLKLSGSITADNYPAIKYIKLAPDNQSLIVVFGDNIQQVKWFNVNTSEPIATQGELNGYASSPTASYKKFLFEDDAAVAVQPDGKYWLLERGNSRLLQYSETREYIDEICWLPAIYTIGVERTLGKRVFAGLKEYAVDYSKHLNEPGAWKLKNNFFRFAEGYEPYIFDVSIFSNGRTYGQCVIEGDLREIIDITDSFKPTGKRFKEYGRINLYPDGVYYVDHADVGNLYRHRKYPIIGFNNNIPQFGPSEILFEKKVESGDPLHMGGRTFAYGERIGSSIITYDDHVGLPVDGFHLGLYDTVKNKFIFKTAKGSGVLYNGPFKTDEEFENGSGTNYPGTCALAMGDFILTGHHGEFYKGAQTNVYKVYHKSGLYLGWFGWYPGLYADNNPKRYWGRAGNALSIYLVHVDSIWYLYTCDESIHSRVHRWRITGLNTFSTQTLPLTLTIDIISKGIQNMIAGSSTLPYMTTYKGGDFGGWQIDSPSYDQNTGDGYDFWQVTSNRVDNKKAGFSATFSSSKVGTAHFIKKPFNIGKQRKWQASFYFHIEQFSVNYGGTQGKIFIRDIKKKAIVELDFRLFIDKGILTKGLFFNNSPLLPKAIQSDNSQLSLLVTELNLCNIFFENGKLTCIYKDFPPVTAIIADTTADISQPACLSIEFSYPGGYALGMTIGLYDVRFFTDTTSIILSWLKAKPQTFYTVVNYTSLMLLEKNLDTQYVLVENDEEIGLKNTMYRVTDNARWELMIGDSFT